MKTAQLLTVLTVLGPLTAAADTLPKPVADMECLVGTWRGAGSLAMGKDRIKIDLVWTCARTPSRYGILCQAKITGIPGVAAYEETDLFGFEPNSGTYHWFSVTNGGETHDHVAKAPTGNKLQFVYTGSQEGKPFKEVIDLELGKDAKEIVVRSESFVAGVSTSVLDVKAKK